MTPRRALITGISGQDGAYLSALLVEKGYEVHGVDAPGHRRASSAGVDAKELDITDREAFAAFIRETKPDEVYHLAAHHRSSAVAAGTGTFMDERRSIETNFLTVHMLLSTLRLSNPSCRVFLAGSCHMFGETLETPQTEETLFAPVNMYGVTKAAATHLGRLYRNEYRQFVCTGILYNHESPLRGSDFVTTRIACGAAEVKRGRRGSLTLGNLDAQVDWGFAGDYVQAMWAMLQSELPEDFIIASGELHTVRDFARIAFERVGLDWSDYVREDSSVHQPVSRTVYHGDIRRVTSRLGWRPSTSFRRLVEMMVDAHLKHDG